MKVSTITGTDGREPPAYLRLVPETIAEASALVFCATSKIVPPGASLLVLAPERAQYGDTIRAARLPDYAAADPAGSGGGCRGACGRG